MSREIMHLIFGLLTVVLAQIKPICTIQCYSCQYTDTDTWQGYSCVSDPDRYRLGPPVLHCPGPTEACYSHVEYYPDRSEIKYAYRGCSDQAKREECIFVGSELHCTYICNHGDRCNIDDLIELKPELITPIATPNRTNRRRYRPLAQTPTTTVTAATAATAAHSSDYFLCYSCTYNYNPHGDDSCVTSPSTARQPNSVICRRDGKHACATRMQFALGDNVIRSFYRGCELVKSMKDSCEKDLHFHTCFSYCQGEFCNGEASSVNVDELTAKPVSANEVEKSGSDNDEQAPRNRNRPVERPEVTSSRRRPGIGWKRKAASSAAVKRDRFEALLTIFFLGIFFVVR